MKKLSDDVAAMRGKLMRLEKVIAAFKLEKPVGLLFTLWPVIGQAGH